MVGIGGHPAQAEQGGVLQGDDVGPLALGRGQGMVRGLLHHGLQAGRGLEVGRRLAELLTQPGLELLAALHRLGDVGREALGVKSPRWSGWLNRGPAGEAVGLRVGHALLPGGMGHDGQALEGVGQEVLQRRHLGVLAAGRLGWCIPGPWRSARIDNRTSPFPNPPLPAKLAWPKLAAFPRGGRPGFHCKAFPWVLYSRGNLFVVFKYNNTC